MIETIANGLKMLGAVTLETVWIPLLLWTAVALPIYLLLFRRSKMHPLVQYHLYLALLLALPMGVLLAGLVDVSGLLAWINSQPSATQVGQTVLIMLPTVGQAAVDPSGVSWNLYHGVGLLTAGTLILAIGGLLRLAWQAMRLFLFRRQLSGRDDGILLQKVSSRAGQMGIRRDIRVVLTRDQTVPMTFGYLRPTIVLPDSIASDTRRLEMTLAHELMHIRRGDYLLQWIEQLIGALFFAHPLVAFLRRKISVCREMVCDEAVINRLSCSRKRYAALLLDLSVPNASEEPFAIAMSENSNNLKRRIQAMKNYTDQTKDFLRPKRVGLTLGGLLLAGAVFIVACSDMVGSEKPMADTEPLNNVMAAPSTIDGDVFIAVEDIPNSSAVWLPFRRSLTIRNWRAKPV